MCVSCLNVFQLFPLLWVILMPVVGVYCGPDTVLRFSLLMLIYSTIENVVTKYLTLAETFVLPAFSIACFVGLICLPVNIIPYPLVWLYGQLVWMTEPILLLVEAVGVIRITMNFSRGVVHHIEDNAVLAKGVILVVTVLAYLVSSVLAVHLFNAEIKWLLCAWIIIVLVHLVLSITCETGVVSDCAVVALCMMGALWAGLFETSLIENPLSEPREWFSASVDTQSPMQLLLSVGTSSMSHATKAMRFLSQLVSPAVLIMIMIRAACVQQSVHRSVAMLKQAMLDEDDEVLEEDYMEKVEVEEDCLPMPTCVRRTSLPTKLSLIFVFTQLVFRTMVLSGGHRPYRAYIPAKLQNLLQLGLWQDIGALRLAQMMVMAVLYPVTLYRFSEEDEESSW